MMTDRELLVRYMRQNGYTQRETARRLGISDATISKYLHGSVPISKTVSILLHLLVKEG